ncbi:MAG: adenylate/guanylate cyclase domain-containing protein [Chloroflexota bacterium]
MIQTAIERRLAAILVTDMVGSVRLTETFEEGTYLWHTRVRREVVEPFVTRNGGRVVKSTGDGFLSVFGGATAATECALEMQRAIVDLTAEQPVEERLVYRMAVNLADIIVGEDDVYGDGVNVAARLQAYAEPGGVVVSGAVAEQLSSDLGVALIDLGDLHMRSLSRAVRVYSLRPQAPPSKLVGDVLSGGEPRPSLAVLPFRMHATDPAEGYFADGVVDDIIHGLAALKELFVVSRASGLGYGGTQLDVRAVGRDLGVRYVLYGSIRRSAGRLTITTELSDAETGTVIRADQYSGGMSELFELQGQIAISVVRTIAPHVHERELVRALRKQPQNLTAYELVLQALDLLYRLDYESFSRARGLLQQAVAHDPTYAPAHAYTAMWYVLRVGEMGSTDVAEDAEQAAMHAATALELEPNDSLCLAIAGHVQSYLLKDYARAVELLDRATAAGPSSAMAWSMSSVTRGFIVDGPTAVKHAEQGVRLSPLDARLFWHEGILGQAHYVSGDYPQALEWARSAYGRNEYVRFTLRLLVATCEALGQHAEAVEYGRQLLRVHPSFTLGAYAARSPFRSPVHERWIEHLRQGGLPC